MSRKRIMIKMIMLTRIIDRVIFLSDPNTIGIGPRKITPPIFDFFEECSPSSPCCDRFEYGIDDSCVKIKNKEIILKNKQMIPKKPNTPLLIMNGMKSKPGAAQSP